MINTIRIIHITILLSILAIGLLPAQETPIETGVIDKIDQYLSDGISNGFSGSILIVKEDQVMLNMAYGLADKENNIPYNPHTVSSIGSVSKQFTATAIMKLVENEKIKVSDPLSHFFKKLPNDKKDITIDQLLTHSSGLIDMIGEGDFDDIQTKKFFKTLFASKLIHQPGVQHSYSNVGYSILARIIELTSGQSYESYLYENLFKPAGMKQTGYFTPEWNEHSIAKGYAYGVISVGSMIQRYQEMGEITWNLKGNGGIHSTSEDMYKWYKALKSNKIISKSSFEILTTPHIKESNTGTSFYGYGWAIFESNRETKIISHNGGNGIYFHDFIWLPKEEILIILFSNSASEEVEVAWKIEKMIFDTAYMANPIKKNLYLLVFDFMKNHRINESIDLVDHIQKKYAPSISHSHILNGLGYSIMRSESEDKKAWALEIFKLNVDLFPEDGNIWDSLGECYQKNEQLELAIKSYKRAIELAPTTNCSWCKSSSKAIKKLNKKNK